MIQPKTEKQLCSAEDTLIDFPPDAFTFVPPSRLLAAEVFSIMADQNSDQSAVPIEIVWPTREQLEKGRAEVRRYAHVWKSEPALLVIKPHLGLIVSLKELSQDDRYFKLTLAVEQVLVAPGKFDDLEPLILRCVWNQPYMHLSADLISPPYSFSLQFGAQGVERARKFSRTKLFHELKTSELLPGLLRGSFASDCELPE